MFNYILFSWNYLMRALKANIGLILTSFLFLLFIGCDTTVSYIPSRSVVREEPPIVVQEPAPAPIPPPPISENPGEVNYQTFYDALQPFGNWVQDQNYGYVWVPNTGPEFQPYQTNGHWIYTSYGWTWVSDFSWGWAPFHYGRWKYDNEYGWLWIPGYTWGPAWVAWRSSGSYYGWAPLGPPRVNPRYQNEEAYESNNIGAGFSYEEAPPEPVRWCFVPVNYVASPQINNYYVNRSNTTQIYNQTTVIHNVTVINNTTNNYNTVNNNIRNTNYNNVTNNNFTNNNITNNINNTTNNNTNNFLTNRQNGYVAGPPPAEVAKYTGHPIVPVQVVNSARPGVTGIAGNSLAFYRPSVRPPSRPNANINNNFTSIPSPRQATVLNRVTPVYQRANSNLGVVTNNPASNLSSTDRNPIQEARLKPFQLQNLNNLNNNRPGIPVQNNRPVEPVQNYRPFPAQNNHSVEPIENNHPIPVQNNPSVVPGQNGFNNQINQPIPNSNGVQNGGTNGIQRENSIPNNHPIVPAENNRPGYKQNGEANRMQNGFQKENSNPNNHPVVPFQNTTVKPNNNLRLLNNSSEMPVQRPMMLTQPNGKQKPLPKTPVNTPNQINPNPTNPNPTNPNQPNSTNNKIQ